MKQILFVIMFMLLLPFAKLEASVQKLYQMPGTQVIPIKDTQSNKQYELLVKLPDNYTKNKDKNYPVIYFTDAVWHIELLSAATEFVMEDVILVGISWQKDMAEDVKQQYGAHVSRYGDYSFKKMSNPKHPKIKFGQANKHLTFIRKDVFEYVEENYRTEPNNRTYFGFSAGGLFGTYVLLAQPDTFRNYILGSPSIGSEAPDLFAQENVALKSKDSAINVFISYGELEKESGPHIEDFISTLRNKKYKGISSIKHVVIEFSGHSDSFPLMGVQSVKWLSGLQRKEDKNVGQDDIQILEGPYLGQTPPGLIPEDFAPGIISTNEYEGNVSFSPDLDEMYFAAKKKGENWSVYFSRLENKKWTNLKKANFTKGESSAESHPFMSPSGKRMYFVDDNDKILYVNRFEDSWGDAIQLDLPINDDVVFNPIEAKNGDLYYFNMSKFKLYYAPNKNGEFPEVREVEIEFGVHGCISPSQDFLVVDARNKNNDNDLYVYFKKQDGTWTKPFDLGNEVNSDFHDSGPQITPDGKYLFFSRSNEDGLSSIYWVSTEVIHRLKPDGL